MASYSNFTLDTVQREFQLEIVESPASFHKRKQ